MSVTRFQVEQAMTLAEQLRDHGFSVSIAGGFARDVYFGAEPKDIDIIVAAGSIHDDVSEAHAILGEILKDLGVQHLGFRMYTESVSDRLVGGFKCVGNVDVVLYDVPLALEAVQAFDFNLNQFVLTGRTFESAYVSYEGNESYHDLVPVREDFTPERFAKMRTKFIDLTCRYPEGQGPVEVKLSDRF
ncbi:nucleotidyltransferase [Pseudomonas phage vB_PpuP-Vasula]